LRSGFGGPGGDEGDVPGPSTVWNIGKRLAAKQIGRGFVCSTVAGFWDEVFWLNRVQGSLGHEAADSGGSAYHPLIGENLSQAAVAVAPPMALEDGLDQIPDAGVGELGRGGCAGVIEAAAGMAEHRAYLADAAAGFLSNGLDHRAAAGWGRVPRMTAAFFKMSFSSLRLAISRRSLGSSSTAASSPTARSPSLPTRPSCESLRTHP